MRVGTVKDTDSSRAPFVMRVQMVCLTNIVGHSCYLIWLNLASIPAKHGLYHCRATFSYPYLNWLRNVRNLYLCWKSPTSREIHHGGDYTAFPCALSYRVVMAVH